MAAVQTSYAEVMGIAVAGMMATAENYPRIGRTASGNIGFGLPVIRSGNHNCVLATQETFEVVGAGVPNAGNTGASAIASVAVSAGAKIGTYTVTAIVGGNGSASKWRVEDPDGNYVGVASGTVAFSAGGVAFTVTDPGTDPVVGDAITFPVTPTAATDVADVLGIAIKDVTLVHDTADRYEQYDAVNITPAGPIFVTAGATVVAGDDVYWNPATSRYTKTTTHLALPGWKFDTGAVDGGLAVIVRR